MQPPLCRATLRSTIPASKQNYSKTDGEMATVEIIVMVYLLFSEKGQASAAANGLPVWRVWKPLYRACMRANGSEC